MTLFTAVVLLLVRRLHGFWMADQATEDNHWGSLVPDRPFLRSLKVTISDKTHECWADAQLNNTFNNCTGNFSLSAVVVAINLCSGSMRRRMATCYTTPNRIAVNFVVPVASEGNVDTDLSSVLSESNVIEATIDLNKLGQTLRWSWMNGQPVYWKASGVGAAGGSLHIKLKPTLQPVIDWAAYPNTGCTATPPFNCNVNASTGDELSAGLVLSVDNTLTEAFAGSVFGTTGSIMGFMMAESIPDNKYALTYALAGPHKNANGSAQLGRLQAFLPQSTLDLLGINASDAATNLNITRLGSEGQNGQVVLSIQTAAQFGTAGLLVDIPNITFSAPKYKLSVRGSTSSPSPGSSPSPSHSPGSSAASTVAPIAGLLSLTFLTFCYLFPTNI
eukprot:g75443.t1